MPTYTEYEFVLRHEWIDKVLSGNTSESIQAAEEEVEVADS